MTERPPASFGQQLRASIVRNLRLKIRDSRKTTAEIFLPLYTLGTLIVLKILIPNPNFPAILEPHGTGKVFEQFDALKNHTVAVVQNGNGSRHHTVQVRAGNFIFHAGFFLQIEKFFFTMTTEIFLNFFMTVGIFPPKIIFSYFFLNKFLNIFFHIFQKIIFLIF